MADGKSRYCHPDAFRCFMELGSVRQLQPFLEDSPQLVTELDVDLRLHDKENTRRRSHIYLFKRYLFVATPVAAAYTNVESDLVMEGLPGNEIGNVVQNHGQDVDKIQMFGHDKGTVLSSSTTLTFSTDFDLGAFSDDDGFCDPPDDASDASTILQEYESEELFLTRRYNLKLWFNLVGVQISSKRIGKEICMTIMFRARYVEMVPNGGGDYQMKTTLEKEEVWFEDSEASLRVIRIIKETVLQANEETLRMKKNNRKRRDSDRSSVNDSDFDNEERPPLRIFAPPRAKLISAEI